MNKDQKSKELDSNIEQKTQALKEVLKRKGISDTKIGRRMTSLISDVEKTMNELKSRQNRATQSNLNNKNGGTNEGS